MNKKGLIGKIILAVVVLIILIVAITAWQAYSLVKTVMSEGAVINADIKSITDKGSTLNKTDCDKIPQIEASVAKIKAKAQGACRNPIISMTVDGMQQIAIKCKDIPALESQLNQGLQPIKILCSNFGVVNLTQTTIPETVNLTNSTQ